MRKQIMIYALLALIIIILMAVVASLLNPLRKSDADIKKNILALTPIGTSMEDVLSVIESNKKWETRNVSYEHGYLKQEPSESRTTVGEKSIRVFIGEYRNIFVTSVTVFWGFDENSKLIDVWVWKDKDSL